MKYASAVSAAPVSLSSAFHSWSSRKLDQSRAGEVVSLDRQVWTRMTVLTEVCLCTVITHASERYILRCKQRRINIQIICDLYKTDRVWLKLVISALALMWYTVTFYCLIVFIFCLFCLKDILKIMDYKTIYTNINLLLMWLCNMCKIWSWFLFLNLHILAVYWNSQYEEQRYW